MHAASPVPPVKLPGKLWLPQTPSSVVPQFSLSTPVLNTVQPVRSPPAGPSKSSVRQIGWHTLGTGSVVCGVDTDTASTKMLVQSVGSTGLTTRVDAEMVSAWLPPSLYGPPGAV